MEKLGDINMRTDRFSNICGFEALQEGILVAAIMHR